MAEDVTQPLPDANDPSLPGQLVSVTETGGTGQTDPQTITGVIRYDIAPQVQAGNQAVTDALNAVLAQYDPTLGPNITEGLKYSDTTNAALSALATNFTPEQQVGILNGLGPFSTNPQFYAHRDPQTEYDVSLINRPAMGEVAQQQPVTVGAAAQLQQQGELATADSMSYLASQGLAMTSEALKVADQMRDGLKHLDQSQVHLQARGNMLGALVQIPTTSVPIMTGVGPVDQQGMWHPVINGYAMSTPARQQMMEQLQRPDVKQYFQSQGITGIDPKFTSTAEPNLATRPPTQAQARQNMPTWDVIQADPRFQQLPPDRQLAMKKAYFDQFAAMAPPMANAIRQDPKLYQQMQAHFVGPQPPVGPMPQVPSLSQRMEQGATNLLGTGKLTAPLREAARDVGKAGEYGLAGVSGMMQGFLPPETERQLNEASGRHPIVKEVAQLGTDIALGTLAGAPIAGPAIMSGVRGLSSNAMAGMPAFTNLKDLLDETLPFSPYQPTSVASSATRAILGYKLLGKAAEYAGPAFSYLKGTRPGALVGKAVGAVGRGALNAAITASDLAIKSVKAITPEVMRRIIYNLTRKGTWSGKELNLLQMAAAAKNMAANLWIAGKLLEELPEIRVLQAGQGNKFRVWLRNDKEVPANKFSKAFLEEMNKVIHNPKYVPEFLERWTALFKGVKSIEGTPAQINAYFKLNGAKHLQVATHYTAKGVRMVQVGNTVEVVGGGYPKRVFSASSTAKNPLDIAWEKAREYVDSLPMVPTSVTDTVAKRILAQGNNPYYILSRVPDKAKEIAKYAADLPYLPHWGEWLRTLMQPFSLPRENFIRMEQNLKIPFYSKMWLPVEKAVSRHKVFSAPWKAEIDNILGKVRAWRSLASRESTMEAKQTMGAGYTYLMETSPGTQAWDDVVKHYGLNEDTGKAIRQWFSDLLPKFGVDPTEFFTEMLPNIQREGLYNYYPKSTLPKSVSYFLDELETGEMPLHWRELDIRSLMEAVIEKGSWNLHVKQAWEDAYKFSQKNAVKLNTWTKIPIDTYLRAVKGWGVAGDKMLMELFGKGMQRLFLHFGEIPKEDAAKLGRQLYAEFYGVNAGQYFAWRPATVVRQFFQTAQTIFPRFGRAMFHGMKAYFEDPFREAKLAQAGVVSEFGAEEGFISKGTAWVRAGDNVQRGFSAYTQWYLWDKHINEYIVNKDFEKFAKLSKLNLFQPAELRVIKQMIDQGDTLEAKYLAGRTASTQTNFDYSFQNRPPVMTGSFIGRLWGQFGVFPFSYQEYLWQGLMRGDWGDRIGWLARWSFANLTLQEAFKLTLGADATNWLWQYPAWFTGGPLAEHLKDIPESIFSHSDQKPGLGKVFYDLFTAPIPAYMAVTDVVKSMGYAAEGDVQGAIRQTTTGFPPANKQGERTKAVKFR